MTLRRCFYAFLLCAVSFSFPSAALAASRAEVDQWFTQQGKTALVSHGSEAFADMSTGELSALEVGAHIPVASMNNAQMASTDELVRGVWQAGIVTSDNEPVGVLVADFSADKPASIHVVGDKTLAGNLEDILTGDSEQELIYDELLKAWFLLQDSSVTAGDRAGGEIIAGVVPAKDFLIQRARNLGEDNAAQIDGAMEEPLSASHGQTRKDISPVFVSLVVLVVAALLTISLLWLRWESQHVSEEEMADSLKAKTRSAKNVGSLLNVTRANSGKEESAPTLRKASGSVRVYTRDEIKD